jgi:glycosyltransferase involved in cell wall biosynthesis
MSEKKKILVVASSQGVYGGIEVFATTLAEHLNEQPNWEVVLAFKLVKGFQWQPNLIKYFESSPINPHFIERGSAQLLKLIKQSHLVHLQNLSPDVVLLSKLFRKPTVATIHNWRRNSRSLHSLLWSFSQRLVSAQTFNSKFVRKTWTQGAESSFSRVIPTVSQAPLAAPATRNRKGFCFVSRWVANKGLEELIQAYANAKLNPDKWPLILMGDGLLKQKISQQLATINAPGIQVLGHVSNSIKHEIISKSKWIVVPPNTKEDMGLTPIEGRRLKTPAIASDDGGIPESAGPSALIFPAGDVDALCQRLIDASRMPEREYLERAETAFSSLSSYIQPLSVYTDLYTRLLSHEHCR